MNAVIKCIFEQMLCSEEEKHVFNVLLAVLHTAGYT